MYKKQKKILLNSYEKSHAWIFTGPKNDQKFKIAKDFSTWVLKNDKSLSDLLIIQKTQKIKIEDSHQIHDFLTLTTWQHKIVIIDNSHSITNSAANSLLKLLEEPKQNSIIIIITDNLYKVLPTIRSRCFILNFPSVHEYEEVIIENYKLSLQSIVSSSVSNSIQIKSDLNNDIISDVLLLTFNRIIKFQTNLICKDIDNEIFPGEYDILTKLKQMKNDQIFWHCKYKEALSLIKDCNDYNLSFNYALSIILKLC